MQSRNGGWGAFDTDNTARVPEPHPVRRHGGDDRSADRGPDRPPARADGQPRLRPRLRPRAGARTRSCCRTQRADGSWWGRWGANFIYGTWSVARRPARHRRGPRRAARAPRGRVAARRTRTPTAAGARRSRSYDDETLAGRGVSHAVADGVGAARPARRRRSDVGDAVVRGVEHLLATQRADGGWDEDEFTGTGFPRHFYLRYWMYRDYFPLMALGPVPRATGGADDERPRRGHRPARRVPAALRAAARPSGRSARRAGGEDPRRARRARDGGGAAVGGRGHARRQRRRARLPPGRGAARRDRPARRRHRDRRRPRQADRHLPARPARPAAELPHLRGQARLLRRHRRRHAGRRLDPLAAPPAAARRWSSRPTSRATTSARAPSSRRARGRRRWWSSEEPRLLRLGPTTGRVRAQRLRLLAPARSPRGAGRRQVLARLLSRRAARRGGRLPLGAERSGRRRRCSSASRRSSTTRRSPRWRTRRTGGWWRTNRRG